MERERFGELFKRLRIERALTLRAFCLQNGFDAGYVSKIERARLPVPESAEALEHYAVALGLERDSDGWHEFHDLAAAERGRVPADLLEDSELVGKLPVLFRSIRGGKLTPQGMRDLAEKIRRA